MSGHASYAQSGISTKLLNIGYNWLQTITTAQDKL